MKRVHRITLTALALTFFSAALARAQSSRESVVAAGKELLSAKGIDLDGLSLEGSIDLSQGEGLPAFTPDERQTLDEILKLAPEDDLERKLQKVGELLLDPQKNREDVEELRRTLEKHGMLDPRALPADPMDTGPAILKHWDQIKVPGAVPPALTVLQSAAANDFIQSCGPAAHRWVALRSKLPALRAEEVEAVPEAVAIIRDYADKCLATSDTLGPARQRYLGAIVGVITYANDPGLYRCTGTRISATTLLTARHCLFPDEGGRRADLELFKFYLAADPQTPLKILRVQRYPSGISDVDLFRAEDDPTDWVLLEVAASSVPFPTVTIAMPAQFEPLNVYGFQQALAVAEEVERRHALEHGNSMPATPWTAKMRFDASPTCLVAATVQGACLIHACQSDVGSSGSPMFRGEPDGGLTLVGVHIRFRRASETSVCASPLLPTIPNIALLASSVTSAPLLNAAR